MSTMVEARAWTLAELASAGPAQVEFTVTADDMARFAALSGDFNPLHTDDAFARGKGFSGVVVYGALLTAKVSQLIGMQLPGRDSVWAGLDIAFRKPLYVGQPAQIEANVTEVSESTGMVMLAIVIRAEGKVLAKGTAEVVLAS
jgi:acyl dehydratase